MPTRLVILVLLGLACREPQPRPAPPPPQPTETPASVMGSIVAANVAWGDAIVRADSATLAGLYAPDAVLMLPDRDLEGSASIVAKLLADRRGIRDSLHATATVTDQLDVGVEKAHEAGTLTYTLRTAGGQSREVKVRYVNFWQLAAGRWQLVRSLRPLP
jgi:ketosteroid isomerase-like protein